MNDSYFSFFFASLTFAMVWPQLTMILTVKLKKKFY